MQLNILVFIVKRFSLFLSVILPFFFDTFRNIEDNKTLYNHSIVFLKIERHLSKMKKKNRRKATAAAPSGLSKYFWLQIDMPSVLFIIDTTLYDRKHKSAETLTNYHLSNSKRSDIKYTRAGHFYLRFHEAARLHLIYFILFGKSNIWECNH